MPSKPVKCRMKAPAKLNIMLKITGKRPDGYHDIVSVMVPVGLYDDIEVSEAESSGIELSCRGLSSPPGRENLAFRAAAAFHREAGIDPRVRLRLEKTIPVAAGLGGGSSDAAGTLLALNDYYHGPLSAGRLAGIAGGLGADVPFFLRRGPCVARGIGDLLEPLNSWPALWYIIVMPPHSVSTEWAYRNFKLELTSNSTEDILNLLKKQPLEISRLLENDLETVTASHFPVIPTIKKALIEAGALGALMSGSGPSVFGVFTDAGCLKDAARFMSSLQLGHVFAVRGL